eukprot:symbB.v1.2.016921.t1/scaffold1304.1/size242089/15
MVEVALQAANSAYVGGVVKEDQKVLLEDEHVKQILGDPQVKRALIMMHQDYPRFFEELESNSRLQVYLKHLLDVGLMDHEEAVVRCHFLTTLVSMDPYVSMVRGQYSSVDVARELQRNEDSYSRNPFMSAPAQGSDFLALDQGQRQEHHLAAVRNSLSNPDFLPMGGSTMPPPEVGSSLRPSAQDLEARQRSEMIKSSLTSQELSTPFDTATVLSPQDLERLYKDATDVQVQDKHLVSSKVVDKQEQKISKVISGKRQCDPIHWIFAIETFVDPWNQL